MTPEAPSQERRKATGLQTQLETQLIALEKLGALPATAADEIRNIVAEGIADRFGEPYRTFPCVRNGTEIRRDAVPKQCSLRQSAQGFVARARSPEKNTKMKGCRGQEKVNAEPATAKERAAITALANLTVGSHGRREKPQKTSSPNQPSPAKGGGTSNERQPNSLDSATPAFDAMLAKKVTGNQASAPAGKQQKQTAQGTDEPMASFATPKNETGTPKVPEAPQPPIVAAGSGGAAPDHLSTTRERAESKPCSPGKASKASSEDLIDLSF